MTATHDPLRLQPGPETESLRTPNSPRFARYDDRYGGSGSAAAGSVLRGAVPNPGVCSACWSVVQYHWECAPQRQVPWRECTFSFLLFTSLLFSPRFYSLQILGPATLLRRTATSRTLLSPRATRYGYDLMTNPLSLRALDPSCTLLSPRTICYGYTPSFPTCI